MLLTIAPDFPDDTFEVGDAGDRRIHGGLEFKHISFLELPGFVVPPIFPSVLPSYQQFLGERRQSRPVRARAHAPPPLVTDGWAASFAGATASTAAVVEADEGDGGVVSA